MLTSFRRLSKSVIGTAVIAVIGLFIIVGFAMGNISSLDIGSGGMGSTTLAKTGDLEVTDRDISDALQRRLTQVRQQDPEATYASLAADFDPILEGLIDQSALQAWAKKQGFTLSKRLVDAEIAKIPGVKGLNGEVTPQSYQAFLTRERMTDSELRTLVSGTLLSRLLITPAATDPKLPVGVATPYASMLLEQREGHIALIPTEAFAEGLNPSDAQVQKFYQDHSSRYVVPEQRELKLAAIGPEQVANVSATEQDVEKYYNAHQDEYGSKDIRVVDQAVVPDQKVAAAIAAKARSGASFAEAAQAGGLKPEDVALGSKDKKEFADISGAKVADAAWSAKPGSVIGPVQSDLGWHVIKIESASVKTGKTLAQAHEEIAEKVTADKRKNALADLVNKIQDSIDGGSNLDEAAKEANIKVVTTPPVTAAGIARGDASYKFPENYAAALKTGFDLDPSDEPAIETLGEDKGFVLVAPARVIPAAPAPLAAIQAQVKADWIAAQASQKARALADSIASAANGKADLADAAKKHSKLPIPVQPARAVRIQLSQMGDKVPEPLKVLFGTAQGKAVVGALPNNSGFFIVKVDKITPGNALNQPQLISEVQKQFGEPLSEEYAQELTAAAKADVKVRRNDPVIAATKKRITGGGF